MSGDGNWWTNPWMVLLFGIAAVPLLAGLAVIVLIARSARSQNWTGTRALVLVLAAAWSIWWALDWWSRATDPRFHT